MNTTEEALDLIEKFIEDKYNEYQLLKVYSACPHSVAPIYFHFVYLVDQKLLVTELLEEYGWESIVNYFTLLNSQ